MFLLILGSLAGSAAGLLFTFHYVSINTKYRCIISTSLKDFTFHYVSINTTLETAMLAAQITLHSTMFLLIQRSRPDSISGEITLHSTMFLLIPAQCCLNFSPLHSTMFLLIRSKQHSKIWKRQLYIPLCFY